MILSLLLAATFDFPGGDSPELAVALNRASGRPVVLLDSPSRVRAAKFDYAGPETVETEARSYFSFLRPVPGTPPGTLGFGGDAFSPDVVTPRPTRDSSSPIVEPDGTVSVPKEGVRTTAAVLAAVLGKDEGALPWYVREVPVAAAFQKAKPEDVRAALWAALGLRTDEKTKAVSVEPGLLRQRWAGAWAAAARPEPEALKKDPAGERLRVLEAELTAAAFRLATTKGIETLFAQPGGEPLTLKDPAASRLAWSYAREYVRLKPEALQALRGRVPGDAPAAILLTTRGPARVTWPTVGVELK